MNGIHEVRGSIPLASIAPAPAGVELRSNGRCAGGERTLESCIRFAGIAQLVEHNLAKVGVAGSSPVSRSQGQARMQMVGTAVTTSRGGAVW